MQNNVYADRQEIQAAAIAAWVPTKKGTLVLSTGVGKTYVAIVIACGQIKKKLIDTCLIVVPTTNLILQWEQEILKWGYPLDGITIKCLQTAYKEETEYDLLVVDEVHTATAEKYSAVFVNTKHKQCLGLSATVDSTNKVLVEHCPVLFSIEVADALKAKAFNAYTVYNVAIPLNRKEQAIYNTFDRQFKLAKLQLLILKKDYPEYADLTIFDIAKKYANSKEKTELVKWSKTFWSAMTMRKSLCYKAYSKAEAAKELVSRSPTSKWVIFTMSIDLAKKLSEEIPGSVVYHSKQKDDERTRILKDYSENKSNCLIAVQALNAGMNIPDIDRAICISGNSSELDAIQRLGRIARVKDTPSIFINLYSKDTIEKTWLENRNKKIDNIVWQTLIEMKKLL